jgi:hypothetical protein
MRCDRTCLLRAWLATAICSGFLLNGLPARAQGPAWLTVILSPEGECQYPKPASGQLTLNGRPATNRAGAPAFESLEVALAAGAAQTLTLTSPGYEPWTITTPVLEPNTTQPVLICPVPAGRLVLRKEQRLLGLSVAAHAVSRDLALAATLDPNVLEATIAVLPGNYEVRAGYVVGPRTGSASSEPQTVVPPLVLSVTPRSARNPDATVIVAANAQGPVIVDVALAELEGASTREDVASAYADACGPLVTSGDWKIGERCANLAFIQRANWVNQREELRRACGKEARCKAVEEREKIWTAAIQGTLERGCKLGSPRACAAWDGATAEVIERECRAEKDTSWVACLRHFARDERPLFYDVRSEPPRDIERAVAEDDSTIRVAIGASVWRSPKRQNPFVIIPFAVRISLLGDIGLGRFGVTSTFGPTIQHLPVLERGSKEVVGSYQLIGLQGDMGWSWSPFCFIRFDGTFFYGAAFNQSASTLGLKAEGALVLGDHELAAMVGLARVPNLGRELDGSTQTNIGGVDLPFFGLSYFYAVREE